MRGLLERVRDHEGDGLTLMANPIVLEHVQALAVRRIHPRLVRAIGEPGGIEVGQDREHAGGLLGRARVEGDDAASRDGARDDRRVGQVRTGVELGRVGGRAGDLEPAVDAAHRLAERGAARHRWPPAMRSARASVAFMSGSLNALPSRGAAPSTARSAAVR